MKEKMRNQGEEKYTPDRRIAINQKWLDCSGWYFCFLPMEIWERKKGDQFFPVDPIGIKPVAYYWVFGVFFSCIDRGSIQRRPVAEFIIPGLFRNAR